MLSESLKINNEGRGLHYSLCDGFNEWFEEFYYQPILNNYPTNRVIDELNTTMPEEFNQLSEELLKNYNRLKKETVQKCILENIKKQNKIIYISQTDELSHKVTISNKNYVSAIGAALANVRFLIETIINHSKDTVLIISTDHGGDESPYQQERSNHETENNKFFNDPFLLTTYSKFDKISTNSKVTIKSTEFAGIVSQFLSSVNIPMFQNLNLDLFTDLSQRFKYLYQFENKMKNLAESLTSFDSSQELKRFMKEYEEYFEFSKIEKVYLDQNISSIEINSKLQMEYESYLLKVDKFNQEIKKEILEYLWRPLLIVLLVICFVFAWITSKIFSQPINTAKTPKIPLKSSETKSLLKQQKNSNNNSSNIKEFIKNYFDQLFILPCYTILMFYFFFSNENDFDFSCYLLLMMSFLALKIYKNFNNMFVFNSQTFISLLLLFCLFISPVFYQISIYFESFFYNNKNIMALLISYGLFALVLHKIHQLHQRDLFISPKTVSEKLIRSMIINLIILILINCVVDFSEINNFAFNFAGKNSLWIYSFNFLSITYLILALIIKALSISQISTSKLDNYINFIFCYLFFYWCGTMYDRFIIFPFTYLILIFLQNKNSIYSRTEILSWGLLIYIFSDMLFKANQYKFDWRNNIRLCFKFDLTGIYRGMYQIYSVFLGSFTVTNLGIRARDLGVVEKYYLCLNLCFFVKYVFIILSMSQETNMFRSKVLENVVITQAFGFLVII